MKTLTFMKSLFRPLTSGKLTSSLKARLYLLVTICSIIPLVLIGGLSVWSISSILDNKIDKGMQSHLQQVTNSLSNTLSYLDYSSQQFTINGLIGKDLAALLEMNDLTDSLALRTDMQNNINLLNFTNDCRLDDVLRYQKRGGAVLQSAGG